MLATFHYSLVNASHFAAAGYLDLAGPQKLPQTADGARAGDKGAESSRARHTDALVSSEHALRDAAPTRLQQSSRPEADRDTAIELSVGHASSTKAADKDAHPAALHQVVQAHTAEAAQPAERDSSQQANEAAAVPEPQSRQQQATGDAAIATRPTLSSPTPEQPSLPPGFDSVPGDNNGLKLKASPSTNVSPASPYHVLGSPRKSGTPSNRGVGKETFIGLPSVASPPRTSLGLWVNDDKPAAVSGATEILLRPQHGSGNVSPPAANLGDEMCLPPGNWTVPGTARTAEQPTPPKEQACCLCFADLTQESIRTHRASAVLQMSVPASPSSLAYQLGKLALRSLTWLAC